MQRQEMLAQLQETLQEPAGGQGAPSKFRLNYLLSQAADDIAAKFECLYGLANGNLVANQGTYPPANQVGETTTPAVIEIFAVSVYDSSGGLHTIQPVTVQFMDSHYAGWRSWLASNCPYFAVTTAPGSTIVLAPAPNYSSNYDPTGQNPGGYTIEGIAQPGHSWDAATAECPLPTQSHHAVVLQAAIARIMQNPTKDNIARVPLLKEALQSELDTFERSVIRYTQATRVPSYTTGENSGASPGYGFNPLDL